MRPTSQLTGPCAWGTGSQLPATFPTPCAQPPCAPQVHFAGQRRALDAAHGQHGGAHRGLEELRGGGVCSTPLAQG
jgi:hypothetical protein